MLWCGFASRCRKLFSPIKVSHLCSHGGVITSVIAFFFLVCIVSVCIVSGGFYARNNESQRPSFQQLLWNIFRISIQSLTPNSPARPLRLLPATRQLSSAARSSSSALLAVFVLDQSTWPSISLRQLAWLGSKIACVGSVIDSNWPLREENRHRVLLNGLCSERRVCVCVYEFVRGCVCLPWWEFVLTEEENNSSGKQCETYNIEYLAFSTCWISVFREGRDRCLSVCLCERECVCIKFILNMK